MASTDMHPEQIFEGLADESAPVLETVLQMNLDSLAACSLDERSYLLVRLAALIAVGAPPASYLAQLALARDSGLSLSDAQGVFVAVAPIVGTPRVTAGAGNILRAFGLAEALEDS
jgi:4-carboxymuconolactone decarboxylase